MSFMTICDHPNIRRINKNFVKCEACGDTFVNQKVSSTNKTSQNFINENQNFLKNFDKHFNNKIDDGTSNKQGKQYYTDHTRHQLLFIDFDKYLPSNPPKYLTYLNNERTYLSKSDISKVINDMGAIRIDKNTAKKLCV